MLIQITFSNPFKSIHVIRLHSIIHKILILKAGVLSSSSPHTAPHITATVKFNEQVLIILKYHVVYFKKKGLITKKSDDNKLDLFV